LEPHAQTHYVEMLAMAKYSRRHNARDFINSVALISLKLLDWLKVPVGQDSKDLHKALAKISPFFFSDFLDTERGKIYKNSMMFNQEERAKNPPDIRTHTSNSFRPQDFWTEFDESADKIDSDYQDARITEYDIAIRPIIAYCKFPLTFYLIRSSNAKDTPKCINQASSAIEQKTTMPVKLSAGKNLIARVEISSSTTAQ
jgi:hypothetical protein